MPSLPDAVVPWLSSGLLEHREIGDVQKLHHCEVEVVGKTERPCDRHLPVCRPHLERGLWKVRPMSLGAIEIPDSPSAVGTAACIAARIAPPSLILTLLNIGALAPTRGDTLVVVPK